MRLPAKGRNTILTLAALAVWAVVLLKAIDAFNPAGSDNNVSFNSDSAIVVLMANDDRPITVFNFYYYCADRWGAWQFVLGQGIRRATGFAWTPQSVLAMQATWVLLGAWAFAGLCRRDWAVAGVAYLVAACLHKEGRLMLFELSQIYGWQITGVMSRGWASGACSTARSCRLSPRGRWRDGRCSPFCSACSRSGVRWPASRCSPFCASSRACEGGRG